MRYSGIRWMVDKACGDAVPADRREWLIRSLREYVEDHVALAKGEVDAVLEMVETPKSDDT